MTDSPLTNAHGLEYRSKLRLVHGVEANLRGAAMSGVLSGEVEDWACEPEIPPRYSISDNECTRAYEIYTAMQPDENR